MYLEKELQEIVSIPSVSSNIRELNRCLDYCVNFATTNIDKSKIFINKKVFNDIPSILFSNCDTMQFDILAVGHVDVVPAKDELFKPKIIGTKLYGRGSADMKNGVLVSLDILKDVIKANKQVKYGVLVVCDEETGGNSGSREWAKLGLNGKILIDYDSGDGFEYISQRQKGSVWVEITTKGVDAHGSMPWNGIDSNDIMFSLIAELRKTFRAYSQLDKPNDTWVSTMHIGSIKGGEVVNKIASSTTAVIDFRIIEKYTLKDVEKTLNTIIEESKYKNYISYKNLLYNKAVFSGINNKYFKNYSNLLEKEIGKKPTLTTFNGSTDMAVFVNENNIVIHHNPNIGPIHSDNEFVDLATVEKLKKIGLQFVLEYTE